MKLRSDDDQRDRCLRGIFCACRRKGVIFFDRNGRVTDSVSTEEVPHFGICRNRPFLDRENQMWIPSRGQGVAVRIDMNSRIQELHARITSLNWTLQHENIQWVGGNGMIEGTKEDGPLRFVWMSLNLWMLCLPESNF